MTMKIGSKVQYQKHIPSLGSKHNGCFLKTRATGLMNTLLEWTPALLSLMQGNLHHQPK